MVEKGLGPEPEEEKDDKAEPAPRTKAGEFLADWLARRAEKQAEEDDDKESDSSSGRIRKAFSRLFPSIASKEEVDDNEQQASLFEEFFGRDMATETAETEMTAPEAEPYSPEPLTEISYDIPHDETEPMQADIDASVAQESAPSPIELPEATPVDNVPEAIRQEQTANPERPVLDAPERTVYDRAAETSERYVDRRQDAAAAAFIGAEVSSRWRDRKIKKRVTKLEKADRKEVAHVMSLEERLENAQVEMLELRRARERQQSEIKEIGEKRPVVERTAQPSRMDKVIEPLDKTKDKEMERVVSTREAPKVIKPETNVPAPEIIMEKVKVAAEHDEAIERKYERRQEVKDEPIAKQAFPIMVGATPLGLAIQQSLDDSSLNKQERRQLAKAAERAQSGQEKSLYRQAAVSGFWTATIILVTLAVIAITTG